MRCVAAAGLLALALPSGCGSDSESSGGNSTGGQSTGGASGTSGTSGAGGTGATATGGQAGTSGTSEGDLAGECYDQKDNDGDGKIDCDDPNCNGTTCRPSGGDCDVEEVCSNGACPDQAFMPATTICRAEAGDCDQAETCTGSSAECPADAFKPPATSCRAAGGPCDVEETCTGTAAACPADAVLPQSVECRPKADVCDAAETCDGTAKVCPSDGFESSSVVCRPAADLCDAPESCTGSSAACPSDGVQPSTYQCRAAAGGCDTVAENCNGTSSACPPDQSGCGTGTYCNGSSCVAKKADGLSCSAGKECTSGYCVDGYCCNSSCNGGCRACNVPGSLGTCSNHPAGSDPESACAAYNCNGNGACFTGCTGTCSTNCKNFCSGGKCTGFKYPQGTAGCLGNCMCQTGHCVDGYCCNTACSGDCKVCSGLIPGTVKGICGNIPVGTDPFNECGNYMCAGNGSCYTSCPKKTTANCLSATCKQSAFCTPQGSCASDLGTGQLCVVNCQCKSGLCLVWLGVPVCS